MESDHAEVDQNTNNSNRDKASNDADPLVFQTPNSNENNFTPHLNLRHQDQLATSFDDPGTEVRIPLNSEAPGNTPAYSMYNSSNHQQYELQGARPKDPPDKLQRPKDFSMKNNLAKGVYISKSVNPSTEEKELRKNEKLKQKDSLGTQFVTSQQYAKQEKDINVNTEVLVNLKDKQIDKKVLKLVCACLNIKDSRTRTLKLRNKHCKTAKSKDFDDWYDRVEKKMKEVFFNHITEYVQLKGDCNSEVLELSVTPAPNLCTLDIYLYFPSVSSADQAKYTKAVDIISQEGPPGPLPTIPNRTYKLDHEVVGLRNENIDTQFKQITGKDVPNTLANMCSHYISAFGNYKGGVVYYGIEDKNGKVVGVDLSNCTQENIETAVERKIGGMFLGNCIIKLKRKEHWDIQYFEVDEDQKGNPNTIDQKRNPSTNSKKIIAVSVCRIPGGVFTAEPESYYADINGNVQRYSFEDWKYKILSSYADAPFTKEGGIEIQRSLAYMSNEISIIKDKVISGNLPSQTSKTKKTETTPQEESQNCRAKKRQVSLPETETTSSKPKILVSPIARPTDPENTCLQTETSKEAKSTTDDLQELQVRYWTSKLEKLEKEKRKLDLENERLERRGSHEQNQSMAFGQIREALGLIADQTEETSQEESLNGSKLKCTATKRQVLLPETESTSNKPKILVPPLARPTDPENNCLQTETSKESKSTADGIQELKVKVLTGKLEKLEKEKKKLDLEIGCLERRGSQEHNNLMTFEQFLEALGFTVDNTALKRQVTLPQPKTTSSRKIANVTPLERQTDSEKYFLQTETTSVLQEQVLEM